MIVRASDGSLADTQTLHVNVTPVNDNAPVITSPIIADIGIRLISGASTLDWRGSK